MRPVFHLPDGGFAKQVSSSAAPDVGPYPASLHANAERALAITYPTLQALLGEHAFEVLSRRFHRAHPHHLADWGEWGEALPDWLAAQAELVELPYLPDVARLDWSCHVSERAADARIDVASMGLAAAQAPERLRLRLAPDVRMLRSTHPIVPIWWAHHGPTADQASWFERANQAMHDGVLAHVIVHRQRWRATPVEVTPSTWAFMRAAHAGHSLARALDEVAPMGFDFVQWLPGAIQQGWVLGFAESDPSSTT